MYKINPAFDRHPSEAAIIGRLLASFGEIEFAVCRNAVHAAGNNPAVILALYRLRMTSSRLDVADSLARPVFDAAGMGDDYSWTEGAIRHCLKIRNQFAHCNWADHADGGLFFADLTDTVVSPYSPTQFFHLYRHVETPLLTKHHEFYAATFECLTYLDIELGRKNGRINAQHWQAPAVPALPPLYNPPTEHVPPMLDEVHRELHLAKALAAQGGPQTPTPRHLEMEAQREGKRMKREAHRQASIEGHSNPDPAQNDDPKARS